MVLVAVACILGAPCLLAMAATTYTLPRDVKRHWHEVAGAAASAAVIVVVGVAVLVGDPVAFHYAGLIAWLRAPSMDITALVAASVPSALIGLPAGVALGAGLLGAAEATVMGAEWHPLERRWTAVEEGRASNRRESLQADVASQRECSSPPLGVAEDGDLSSWRDGEYAVVGRSLGSRGLALVGTAGMGKTVTAERLVAALANQGRRIVFADCKGTDPDLASRVVAGYLDGAGRTDARVHVFPDEPLAGWLGSASEVANRLLSTQETFEPYYAATLQTVVRSAVAARGDQRAPSCSSSKEFMHRLSPEFLAAAYKGTDKATTIAALLADRQALRGVALRFDGLFDAVAGGFDGVRSWGDAEVIFLRVPRLAAPADAEAIMRIALADFSQYCGDAKRKSRVGDDVTLIIDEMSAITGLAPLVIDLAERVRDVGGQVMVTAQSWQGLGRDDDERARLRGAMAAFVVHQCADPDQLCEAAGTERLPEQSWQLDVAAPSGMGSVRLGHHLKVQPDAVRKAAVGEAWVISGGRYLHIHVLEPHPSERLPRAQALVAESVSRGRRERVCNQPSDQTGPTTEDKPTAPTWLDDLSDDHGECGDG